MTHGASTVLMMMMATAMVDVDFPRRQHEDNLKVARIGEEIALPNTLQII